MDSATKQQSNHVSTADVTTTTIDTFVRERFAARASLPAHEIFRADVTLRDVMLLSEAMTNSVDLMEAFAATANAVKKTYGVRIRLPSYPLDTPVSTVMQALSEQVTEKLAELRK